LYQVWYYMLLVYPDYVEYEFDKDRLSVRFLVPYSEGRKKAVAEQARRLLNPTSKQKASTDQTAGAFSFAGQQKTILSMEVPL